MTHHVEQNHHRTTQQSGCRIQLIATKNRGHTPRCDVANHAAAHSGQHTHKQRTSQRHPVGQSFSRTSDRPHPQNDGIRVGLKQLPRPAPQVNQHRQQAAQNRETHVHRLCNRRRCPPLHQRIAQHTATECRKQRQKTKTDDVKATLACDRAANGAIEHNANQVQAAIQSENGGIYSGHER